MLSLLDFAEVMLQTLWMKKTVELKVRMMMGSQVHSLKEPFNKGQQRLGLRRVIHK